MSDECLNILTKWIMERKKETYSEYIKSDGTNDTNEDLRKYKEVLESLERKIRKAVYLEDFKNLEEIGWPSELMECIKDMSIRCDLLDLIYESFITHSYNRSPMHEKELQEENAGLN